MGTYFRLLGGQVFEVEEDRNVPDSQRRECFMHVGRTVVGPWETAVFSTMIAYDLLLEWIVVGDDEQLGKISRGDALLQGTVVVARVSVRGEELPAGREDLPVLELPVLGPLSLCARLSRGQVVEVEVRKISDGEQSLSVVLCGVAGIPVRETRVGF